MKTWIVWTRLLTPKITQEGDRDGTGVVSLVIPDLIRDPAGQESDS